MKQIFKASAAVVILNYMMLVANYIFATLLLRADYDALYGHFVFLNSLQNFIIILMGAGLQLSIVRLDVSEQKFKELSLMTHLLMKALLFVTTLIYLATQELTAEIISIAILSYVTTWVAIVQPFYQWHEKMPQYQSINMWISVLKVFFSCLLFVSFVSHTTVFWMLAVVSLIYSIVSSIRSGLFLGFAMSKSTHLLQELWALRSSDLWIALISAAVYNTIAVLTLPLMGFKAAAIGNYGYSFSLLAAVIRLPGVLQLVLMRPIINSKLSGRELWAKTHHYYIVLGVVIGGIFSFAFAPIVNWAAGDRPDLLRILQAFAPSIPLVFVVNILGLALLDQKNDRDRMISQIMTALAITISLFILVPRFGLIGAAYATTISYFVLYSCYLVFVIRHNYWGLKRSRWSLILFGVILLFSLRFPACIFLSLVVLPFLYRLRSVDTDAH